MNETNSTFRLHLQTLFNALAFLLFLSNTPMSLSVALMGTPQTIAPLRANLIIVLLLGSFVLEFISLFYYAWIINKGQKNNNFDKQVSKYQLIATLSLILLFSSIVILNVLPNALFG